MSEVEELLREAARDVRRDTAKKLSPEVDMARQAIQAQMNKGGIVSTEQAVEDEFRERGLDL